MNNICAGEKIIHHRVTEITEILFVLRRRSEIYPEGRANIAKP